MPFTQRPIQAVLFDLDGTLLDTATDLGHALNNVLIKRNRAPLSQGAIRPSAGRGCRGLLKIGFDIEEDHPDYAELCADLLAHYHIHLAETTQLFPGMAEVLRYLDEAQTPWGIVTNKPERFTLKLIETLQLASRAACVVSGDSLKNRKPHPEPILHACQLMHKDPAHCLYIGDSEIDMIASKAAGSPALVALYGYIPETEDPYQWSAEGYIKHPSEIITLLT